ncbi:MAG: hypothetical protein M5R42_05485 [Rhodocyclaceae bacterium]|nr:hypothetical protein [Rhodocyclaceae bacterium]
MIATVMRDGHEVEIGVAAALHCRPATAASSPWWSMMLELGISRPVMLD